MKLFFQVLTLTAFALSSAFANTKPNAEIGLASTYNEAFHGKTTASSEKYDQNAFTGSHKTLPFGTIVKVTRLDNNKSVNVRINDRGPFEKGRIIDLSKKAAEAIDLLKVRVAKVKIEVVKGGTTPNTNATAANNTKPAETTKPEPKEEPKTASRSTKPVEEKSSSSRSTSTPKQTGPKKDERTSLTVLQEASGLDPGGLYKMQVLKLEPAGYGVQIAGYSDYEAVVKQISVLQKNWFKGSMVYVDELNGKPFYKVILGSFFTKEEASSYCKNLKKKYKLEGAFVVELSKLGKKE